MYIVKNYIKINFIINIYFYLKNSIYIIYTKYIHK